MRTQEESLRPGGFVLGIDAGGTTTRLLLAEGGRGAPMREVHCPSRRDGVPAFAEALARILRETAVEAPAVRAACAGITKISRAGVREAWEAELARCLPYAIAEVVPDFVIAFWGATGGVGIAALAGTGSVIYGEDGRGNAARVGGLGWEYGDEGSGAWLTTEAVRRTLHAVDGVADPSPLTDAVRALLGGSSAAEVAERARQRAGTEGRGFLVPLLAERSRSGGDAEATDVFRRAGELMARQAAAAAQRLEISEREPILLATVGGLWEVGEALRDPFRESVMTSLPRAEVIAPRESPVQGAARYAAARLTKQASAP